MPDQSRAPSRPPSRAVVMTGHSLIVQRDAPSFEWLIAGNPPPEMMEEFASLSFALCHSVNDALEKASGEYVLFLPAGDCLSDAYVLRDLRSDLTMQMMPDFLYGIVRENGWIKPPRPFGHFTRTMITALQAMVLRRRVVGSLRFSTADGEAADYGFMVRFLDKAQTIATTPRILADVMEKPVSHERLQALMTVRDTLLQQAPWKNALIDRTERAVVHFRERAPRLYRFLRGLFLPSPHRRKPSPVKFKYRGIFFKKK